MKKKVLISIVGIALFAVAIGFGLNNTQEDNLKVKNIEALAAGYDHIMDAPDDGGGGSIPCSWACNIDYQSTCVLCGSTCDVYSGADDDPANFWCAQP